MQSEARKQGGVLVEDAPFGYRIVAAKPRNLGIMTGRALSFVLGIVLMIGCFGTLVLPTLFFGAPFNPVRIGAAVLSGAAGAYLIWFSSRGSRSELHVDTSAREIRDVVMHQTREPFVVQVYPFAQMSDVRVEASAAPGVYQLIVAQKGDGPDIQIAEGQAADLGLLRDRLASDVTA